MAGQALAVAIAQLKGKFGQVAIAAPVIHIQEAFLGIYKAVFGIIVVIDKDAVFQVFIKRLQAGYEVVVIGHRVLVYTNIQKIINPQTPPAKIAGPCSGAFPHFAEKIIKKGFH
jgi:hypothetical protein